MLTPKGLDRVFAATAAIGPGIYQRFGGIAGEAGGGCRCEPGGGADQSAPGRARSAPLGGGQRGADIFYLASEVTLARGGDYLLSVGGTVTLRVFVDGVPVS